MEDDDQEMSYAEKSKLPYSLLFDPVTGIAAAYTNNHRLIVPTASPALVAFAKAHLAHQARAPGLWGQWLCSIFAPFPRKTAGNERSITQVIYFVNTKVIFCALLCG